MLRDDHDVQHVVAVANAVLPAKQGDPLRSALGLTLFASVLTEDQDEVAKTTLALAMLYWHWSFVLISA